jgi:hypothetical protein
MAGARICKRFLQAMLYGVSPCDPVILSLVALLLPALLCGGLLDSCTARREYSTNGSADSLWSTSP